MRRFWIVLLLVALLPLRGWAVAAVDPAPAAVPPCHQSADAADAAEADTAAPDCACDLCALCHSPAVAVPAAFGGIGAAPVAPDALQARDTGRIWPERLEKPPRIARG